MRSDTSAGAAPAPGRCRSTTASTPPAASRFARTHCPQAIESALSRYVSSIPRLRFHQRPVPLAACAASYRTRIDDHSEDRSLTHRAPARTILQSPSSYPSPRLARYTRVAAPMPHIRHVPRCQLTPQARSHRFDHRSRSGARSREPQQDGNLPPSCPQPVARPQPTGVAQQQSAAPESDTCPESPPPNPAPRRTTFDSARSPHTPIPRPLPQLGFDASLRFALHS